MITDFKYLTCSDNIIIVLNGNSVHIICDISTMNFYELIIFHSHITLNLITPETLLFIKNFTDERNAIVNSFRYKVSLRKVNYINDEDDNFYENINNIV